MSISALRLHRTFHITVDSETVINAMPHEADGFIRSFRNTSFVPQQ